MLTARGSTTTARWCAQHRAAALVSRIIFAGVSIVLAACASAPPVVVKPPVVTWEEKLGWIIRLEDERILRDPNPPPPVVLVPAAQNRPAIVAPPPPSDLIRLLTDEEARVRRRAALAVGRVGLSDGVMSLQQALADPVPEVRQMAAFALGLIGDASARPALLAALTDGDPMVQGRAAEALGTLGNREDSAAIAAMVRARAQGGALASVAPDDLAWPLSPPVEAARLGIYAVVRLGQFEGVAAAVLDGNGMPVSTWWPIAYALARVGDQRAVPALVSLLSTPGRFTAAFAARGLGTLKASTAFPPLRDIVTNRQRDPAVVIQAVRALATARDPSAAPLMTRILADRAADPTLRLEAGAALVALHSPDALDFTIDLISDPVPGVRGAALRALAALDPDTFLTTLSGLDADDDWTVRTALAEALGALPEARGVPRLTSMLADREPRVVAAVLSALAVAKAPELERILLDRLKSPDLAVRLTAASALADAKAASAVPALMDAFRAAMGADAHVVRAAMLSALNAIDPAAARPLLQEALRDAEWVVRVKALAMLRQQGALEPAIDIRPATLRPVSESDWRTLLAPPYSPHAYIETDRGTIEIELAILEAPLTVTNFVTLARQGFFNGIPIHRVVPDFVVQGGDPRGDGEGGPGFSIRDELNQLPYLRGTVGMALDGKDSGGSQFFITHSPQPHLDARYTAFGQVVAGIDVVDRIQQWDVIRRVRIWDGTTPP